MKKTKILLVSICLIAMSTSAFAQKYCYVNTEYILENIPEYKSAQQQLDQISIQWQKEIEARYTVIDKLYKDYQADQILLTEDMRKKREAEIVAKEKEVKDLQKQRFGVDGDLFKKKQEIVKPIQDKIYNAIKKMATDQSYAVVFDKSSGLTMLYANPKYDKSDEILLHMGYKAGKSKTDGGSSAPSNKSTNSPDSPQQPPQEKENNSNMMQGPK